MSSFQSSRGRSFVRTSEGWFLSTEICEAIKEEDYEQIVFLLDDRAADPNTIVPEYGVAPMHMASGSPNESFGCKVVKLFLTNKGNANLLSVDKMTPVAVASLWGKPKVLRLLMKHGGDPFICDNESNDAFDYAELNHDKETKRAVLSVLRTASVNRSNYGSLYLAKFGTQKWRKENDQSLQTEVNIIENPSSGKSIGKIVAQDLDEKLNDLTLHPRAYSLMETHRRLSDIYENNCNYYKRKFIRSKMSNITSSNKHFGIGNVSRFPIESQKKGQLSHFGLSEITYETMPFNQNSLQILSPHYCSELSKFDNPNYNSAGIIKSDNESSKMNNTPMFVQTLKDLIVPELLASETKTLVGQCKNVGPTANFFQGGESNSHGSDISSFITADESELISEQSCRLTNRTWKSLDSVYSVSLKLQSVISSHLQELERVNESGKSKHVNKEKENTTSCYEDQLKIICSLKEILCKAHSCFLTIDEDDFFHDDTNSVYTSDNSTVPSAKNVSSEMDSLITASSEVPIGSIKELASPPSSSFNTKGTDSLSPSDELVTMYSTVEQNLLTDDNSKMCLIEQTFKPENREKTEAVYCITDDNTSENSLSSENSAVTVSSYDSTYIRNKLIQHGMRFGPITKTTKRVYVRMLHRLSRKSNPISMEASFETSEVLRSTFGSQFENLFPKWSGLEEIMMKDFSKKKRWQGGFEKSFFNYLLLDPRVTENLPLHAHLRPLKEVWEIFLQSVFYIGKGKHSRPYAHLYEARKATNDHQFKKKVERIKSIWAMGQGVVCLHIFHGTISAEAFTREAAMIEAIFKGNLTNGKRGEYHGIVNTWSMKHKCQLGTVLLYRALKIYLAEGERQISPFDL